MDVTTLRTTPTHARTATPSSTVVWVNGGVLRIYFSWPSADGGIPNRGLSASRSVGPNSKQPGGYPEYWDLPPPRAQRMCETERDPGGSVKARPTRPAAAEMGRSTDAEGEENVRRLLSQILGTGGLTNATL